MEIYSVSREIMHEITEGPYYKKGSPERINIVEDGTIGEKLIVEGRVITTKGEPVGKAWLDFWQADGKGEYDNVSYNLRGHQYTDENGGYRLETVIPAMYGNRTPHIHLKLRAKTNSRILTTQLFFPGESRNQTDPIFDNTMVVNLSNGIKGKHAGFDFIVSLL